eukprot:TRINITY_DN22094_c0_g1_i1.p1 TRINITY_DN22094_c0_g1~~TRINITY_DN22094_c0_g1_i1.p1  ORF type:complete len:309 (-),score=44.10 TRINITY_DN22094_c0_g1_i1:756-1649(-)
MKAYKLTQDEKQFFEKNGYLIIKGLVPDETCAKLKNRMHKLVSEFDLSTYASLFSTTDHQKQSNDYFLQSGDKISFFWEEDAFEDKTQSKLRQAPELSLNKVGHALHNLDPTFKAFVQSPTLKGIAQDLMNHKDPRLLQSMYIFKQPKIGGVVKPHKDNTFLFTEPLSCLALWFALEDATKENGCMWVLPGSHKQPPVQRFKRNSDSTGVEFERLQSQEVIDKELASREHPEQYICADVPSGSLILMHGNLVHKSFPNTSTKSRHAFTLHIIDGAAQYPTDNWLQNTDKSPFAGFEV